MQSTFNPETNARMRAIILQAVNAKQGMTYVEIRDWIRQNKRFEMENVGARVRELAHDKKFIHYVRTEQDKKTGHIRVYPLTEQEIKPIC